VPSVFSCSGRGLPSCPHPFSCLLLRASSCTDSGICLPSASDTSAPALIIWRPRRIIADMRVAVIGNSGGGKSVLARRLAHELQLPCIEIDSLLWLPGWKLAAPTSFDQEHARVVAGDRWVIEGLGAQASLPARLQRATHIVLIDMPLWVHFWLAAERHIAWSADRLEYPPAGSTEPAPLRGLFRTIAEVDRDWMPEMRKLVKTEEHAGKRVVRLQSYDELASFSSTALSAS